jgi:signal transduction histidine kinase
LTSLIGDVVSLIEPKCRHANIALKWQPPSRDAIIEGDSAQLQELFLNVLTNAVEAAGPEGAVEVVLRQEEARSIVEISDSGPGPPADVADRLFEPFVTGKPEGIGLGLAVARQVAESHHGLIIWNRNGNRTCFRIELGDAVSNGMRVVQ